MYRDHAYRGKSRQMGRATTSCVYIIHDLSLQFEFFVYHDVTAMPGAVGNVARDDLDRDRYAYVHPTGYGPWIGTYGHACMPLLRERPQQEYS